MNVCAHVCACMCTRVCAFVLVCVYISTQWYSVSLCVYGSLAGQILNLALWMYNVETIAFFSARTFQPCEPGTLSKNKESATVLCVVLVAQSCLTLCNPMDCSPPGFSIHGILQARVGMWVAISSSNSAVGLYRKCSFMP